jgi:AraC-like DNA-binding protein
MTFNILRSLCGTGWKPSEILFAHRSPADIGPYRRLFGCRLVFDAEEYGVAFHASWLARPLPEADASLRKLLQLQVRALHARYGDDLPAQVRSVLVAAVMSRQANADKVAAMFAVHSRTLNRRLAAYGTSFKALADESRYAVARQLLETSSLNVATIADSLDYADASAFTRAFRRWSGDTPARWRRKRNAAKS